MPSGRYDKFLGDYRVSDPAIISVAVTRSLNTIYKISDRDNYLVNYSVSIEATLSVTSGQLGTIFLEISPNGSTGWVEINRYTNGNTGTLMLGLNTVQTGTGGLSGCVPAGWSFRLRTANTTGTPTYTYNSGQEIAI